MKQDELLFSRPTRKLKIYRRLTGVCSLRVQKDQLKSIPFVKENHRGTEQPTSRRVELCPWPYITSGSFCPSHLHDAAKELPSRGDEGIHPGCSLLTLMVIAHFNAKAFFFATVRPRMTEERWSRRNFLETFSRGSIVMWEVGGVVGLEPFSPSTPQSNICLSNLIVLGIPGHPFPNAAHSSPAQQNAFQGDIKRSPSESVRLPTMSEEFHPAAERHS